jgi:hypothetical protein
VVVVGVQFVVDDDISLISTFRGIDGDKIFTLLFAAGASHFVLEGTKLGPSTNFVDFGTDSTCDDRSNMDTS